MQVDSQILTRLAEAYWSVIVSICFFQPYAIFKANKESRWPCQPQQEQTFLILNQSQRVYQMVELFYHKIACNEPWKGFIIHLCSQCSVTGIQSGVLLLLSVCFITVVCVAPSIVFHICGQTAKNWYIQHLRLQEVHSVTALHEPEQSMSLTLS